ncbi:MAG: ABC transporter ATP-binding protein [Thermoanaerobaculales bacterium]
MRAKPLLDLSDLVVGFPAADGRRRSAVDGVSLMISAGQRLGLVGESGCGKSLTALACIGLVPAPGRILGGRVMLAGTDMIGAPDRTLRSLRGGVAGLVFQEAAGALNPVFSLGFQIAEVLRVHRGLGRRQAREATLELLDRVAIEDPTDLANRYPHEVSGGQAQRAMLALALAARPRLLIADEPTSGLDLLTQAQVLDLLGRATTDEGLSLLLISHDLDVVAGMVDRVAVMHAGLIVEEGPAEDFFSNPLHPYSRMLLAAAPGRRSGSRYRRRPPPSSFSGGCRYAIQCPLAQPRCREEEPSLEETAGDRRVRCPIVLHGCSGDTR